MRIKTLKKEGGFTLVETLVAVGIFSVIMMVAAGSLLTIIDANAKAQAIKTSVNNVNFAVETVSNALMTADPATIKCFNPSGLTDCVAGGSNTLSFV
jgi:prepilin-type N-terminal cleavage/methylation domain-containing protein